MCGIAGFIYRSAEDSNRDELRDIATRMANTLVHRGPDDHGTWIDPRASIAFSFRRLAIIDLSPAGHQPMESACGRFVLIFNGEVYNFTEIRQDLTALGHAFKGHSDTEVILAGVREWGIESIIKRLVGMFAIALWDRQTRSLYLTRDRMGEKPLYYGWSGSVFLFGSELKALRAHPDWVGAISNNGLTHFVQGGYVPTPFSIYEGILKLIPGTILKLEQSDIANGQLPEPRPFWSFASAAIFARENQIKDTDEDAVNEFERLLSRSVAEQMVADVPLGAFLSGGVDSSTIVALMQAQSSRPIKTFTIGFNEDEYNEAHHAKAVAEHLGTEHTELYVSPAQAQMVIPKLPLMFDEPFADSSQIPTYLVAELAKQQVTVSLSGDAADELFGGYTKYSKISDQWRKVARFPVLLRHALSRGSRALSIQSWNSLFQRISRVIPPLKRFRSPGQTLYKTAEIFEGTSLLDFYLRRQCYWTKDVVLHNNHSLLTYADTMSHMYSDSFAETMMLRDSIDYLLDDILVKVDRASMAVSLENRVPLLDYRIVEFALRLPSRMKIREGTSKWILRQVLYRHVPKKLIERPKMGFGVPIGDWMRGPLRDWAESLLDEAAMKQDGYLHTTPIQEMWRDHLSGGRNWQYRLWPILMFQAWLRDASSIAPR